MRANIWLFVSASLVAVAAELPITFIMTHVLQGMGVQTGLGVHGNASNPLASFGSMRSFLLLFGLANLLLTILITCMTTPCMVAVHRFILCNQSHAAFSSFSRLRLFAGLLLLIRLVQGEGGLSQFLFRGHWGSIAQNILGLGGFIFALVCVRFVLAFPAIALDIPNPVRDSWVRTRGHWWYIVGIFVVGCLSTMLLLIPASIVSTIVLFLVSKDWMSSAFWIYFGIENGLILLFVPVLLLVLHPNYTANMAASLNLRCNQLNPPSQ
jgi:hypothetical protein